MVLFCATALLLALAVPGARGSALAPPPVQPYPDIVGIYGSVGGGVERNPVHADAYHHGVVANDHEHGSELQHDGRVLSRSLLDL